MESVNLYALAGIFVVYDLQFGYWGFMTQKNRDAFCVFLCPGFAGFLLLRSRARYMSTDTSFRRIALLIRAASLYFGTSCAGARDEIMPARFLGVVHLRSLGM